MTNPHQPTPSVGSPRLAETLVNLSGKLMSSRDAHEAARHAAVAADHLIGWDAAFVTLFDATQKSTTVLFMADEVDGRRVELEEEIARTRPASAMYLHAVASGPIVINREAIDQASFPFHSFGDTSRHTESLLYAPIRDRDLRSIGLLSIQSYTKGRYCESDLGPLRLLADLVGHNLLRYALEESLQKQDSLLSVMMEELPAIIWTTDRELRFTYSAGAGLRSVGLSPGQVVGMPMEDYLLPGETEPRVHHLRALAGEEVVYDSEAMGRFYHATLRPLRDRSGEIIGVIGVATDATEQRQAEKARRELEMRMLQTQKLESLGVLAGGIAHDFNNLLVGILGNAGLALQELGSDHPAREAVELIEQTGERMRDLTRQLLAYSGRGRFMSRLIDVVDVVREVEELLRSSVSKKAEFSLVLPSEPMKVLGDAMQLRQLLLNLASNASESLAEAGGRVAVRLYRKRLSPSDLPKMLELPRSTDSEFAVLEVEDTGSGIREELIGRVMDPFFTTKAFGRGLGMAAVQGITRTHHAGVQIDSIAGIGTVVRVFIPIQDETSESPAPGLRKTTGRTILIAEDEPVVRRFMVDVLKRDGFEVLVAENGESAYAVFRANPSGVHLALLDVVMPRLGGPEAYLRMIEDAPTLPALFISGASDEDLTRKGLRITPKNFLAKPFSGDVLLDKVRAFF